MATSTVSSCGALAAGVVVAGVTGALDAAVFALPPETIAIAAMTPHAAITIPDTTSATTRFDVRNCGASTGSDVIVPAIGGAFDGVIGVRAVPPSADPATGVHGPLAMAGGPLPGGMLCGPVSDARSGSFATTDASATLRAGSDSCRSMIA